MEHYYLLPILSINLRNTGELLYGQWLCCAVLREEGQEKGCALKACVETV